MTNYTVGVRAQLSFMMLLEYFIWGAWYVTLGTYMTQYLNASGTQIGAAYGALAIATIISPFFIGFIADKYFAAQRIMGVLHLVGAVLLFLATQIKDNTAFYWLVLVYSMLYMPTIALSNNIAFSQMNDAGKQFPWIRVFGTLGWIAAGILISSLGFDKENSIATFQMAAIASGVLGLFSFVLPNTPPKGKTSDASASSTLGLDAFVLFKNRSYTIFFISAILICIPLSFYYGFANVFLNSIGVKDAAAKMTFGQASEAIFIIAIPFLFNSIGVKNMLLMGILAWLFRYICFAFGNITDNMWMIYAGIILHGICYDFFFVTGYMYTEKKASEKIKNSAQALFTLASYGIGMVIGTYFSGFVVEGATSDITDWHQVWMVPAYISFGVLIFFLLLFKEKKQIETAA
ncbi:MAG: nucleoside permease [Bacteroidota bacterium]